jgi:16S rRNA (cytidine1402-2'-O)-methyltransferase
MSALYIVATPIGNLEDISARAVKTLQQVSVVFCEDTRHSKMLLDKIGVETKLKSCHEHNEAERVAELCDLLAAGASVALISDAGTPLISDPGYRLVLAARQAGFDVLAVPGCCAVIAALSVSGLACHEFQFAGFLPHKKQARQKALTARLHNTVTTIYYESVHRIKETLTLLVELMPDREIFLAKELTKQFEQSKKGKPEEVLRWLLAVPERLKGEFVLIVGPSERPEMGAAIDIDADRLLALLQKELPPKRAAHVVSEVTGVSKKILYQRLVRSDADS